LYTIQIYSKSIGDFILKDKATPMDKSRKMGLESKVDASGDVKEESGDELTTKVEKPNEPIGKKNAV
jgi:hypothetical protein